MLGGRLKRQGWSSVLCCQHFVRHSLNTACVVRGTPVSRGNVVPTRCALILKHTQRHHTKDGGIPGGSTGVSTAAGRPPGESPRERGPGGAEEGVRNLTPRRKHNRYEINLVGLTQLVYTCVSTAKNVFAAILRCLRKGSESNVCFRKLCLIQQYFGYRNLHTVRLDLVVVSSLVHRQRRSLHHARHQRPRRCGLRVAFS